MRIILISLIGLSAIITSVSCDRPAPLEDLDRQEELPVEDTFEPAPTELP
jgi:hypothetical protein